MSSLLFVTGVAGVQLRGGGRQKVSSCSWRLGDRVLKVRHRWVGGVGVRLKKGCFLRDWDGRGNGAFARVDDDDVEKDSDDVDDGNDEDVGEEGLGGEDSGDSGDNGDNGDVLRDRKEKESGSGGSVARVEHPSGREWEHHALGPTIAAVVAKGMIAATSDDGDEEGVEGKGKVNVKAKVALLRMLPYVINLNSQRARLETLIRSMEASPGAKPLTEGFASLGLEGRWLLLFSSTTLGSPVAAGLRIRRIGQRIDSERKTLVNFAEWSLIGRRDPCEAILYVKCTFRFIGAARIEVTLKEHEIRPREEVYKPKTRGKKVKKSVFPPDLDEMVQQLQRSLPREFFDPSGKIDISYLDADCRIAKFIGKRLAGVRNVYVKDIPFKEGGAETPNVQ